jgi:hypothetical protein
LFKKGEAAEVALSGLQPGTRTFYQLDLGRTKSGEFSFHTARPPGGTFSFTITADSHLDERTTPALYQKTLADALAGAPDFHIDLGDTFMTEKHANREAAEKQYLAQRYYFGPLCQAAPLFLVLGNYDGESPRGRGSDADGLAAWSNTMRKRYFPNPVPDGFYTGNAAKHPEGNGKPPRSAAEYGYKNGVILGGSGHLRVAVTANEITVAFVRASNTRQNPAAGGSRQIAHSYSVSAR